MWKILYGLLAGILGYGFLKASTRIQSEEGDYYEFSDALVGLTIVLSLLFSILLTDDVFSMTNLLWIGMSSLLAIQFILDMKYMELANEWNSLLSIIGIPLLLFQETNLIDHLWAWGILSLFFGLWWAFTNGLGFGDVKLILSTSYLLTVDQVLPYLSSVLFLGVILGVAIAIFKKDGLKTRFAFGPVLIIGLVLMLIY